VPWLARGADDPPRADRVVTVADGLAVAEALAELGLGLGRAGLGVALDVAGGVARVAADEAAEDFEATLVSADPLEIRS